jgi:predicted lipid-binding transport protein (Tim44 family)
MKFWTVFLALVLALGAMDADAARRLGGGGSIGRQSGNVTQRYNTPPAAPTAPSNVQRPATPQPAPAPAVQPQRRPWAGMLGGLAAGLGLAWLAHSLGLGAGFGNVMLILLLVMLALGVFAFLRSRRQASAPAFAFPGGVGATADAPASPREYNPAKVGNDASARPWERATTSFDSARDAGGGLRIGSGLQAAGGALEGSQSWGVPPGFDAEGFLNAAKRNFVTLQEAWDRGDLATLRSMMTDGMFNEIRAQIVERDRGGVAPQHRTEVEMLEAQLLGIEELADEYLASVEFSGMIREEPSAGPTPFREVWNMVKPKDNSAGWLVAGVQALQ